MAYRVSYPVAAVQMPPNARTGFNMPTGPQPRMGVMAGAYPMMRVPARMQYFPQPAYRQTTYIYGAAPADEGETEQETRGDPTVYPGQDLYDPRQRPSLS